MKKQQVYNYRLAVFASRLAQIDLKSHPSYGKFYLISTANFSDRAPNPYYIRIHAWIFEELPKLFPKDWYYDQQLKEPCLTNLSKSEHSIAGVFDYFGLDLFEFIHLFSVDGAQNPDMYGGSFIYDYTEIQEIAKNILVLIRKKSPEDLVN